MREMKENLKQKKEVKWKNIKEEKKRSYKSESAGPGIRAWSCHESSAPAVTKKGRKERNRRKMLNSLPLVEKGWVNGNSHK